MINSTDPFSTIPDESNPEPKRFTLADVLKTQKPKSLYEEFGISEDPVPDYQDAKVPFDENFDPSMIKWTWTYTDPSLKEDHEYYGHEYTLAALGQRLGIVGQKSARKTYLALAMLASLHTDDPEITMGFRINIRDGFNAVFYDTEQEYYRLQILMRRMKDVLGLRADTLRVDWVSLANPKWDSTQKKRVVLDDLKDRMHCTDLVLMDSLQDLVWGGNYNSQPEANMLSRFIQYMVNIRGEDDVPMNIQLALHTKTDGSKGVGKLGTEIDRVTTAQINLTHMKGVEEAITIAKCGYARDARFASFAFDHDKDTNWLRHLGKPEVNNEDPFA